MVASVLIAATAVLAGAIGGNVVRSAAPAVGRRGRRALAALVAARVSELAAAGRPVFVDFTAAWCVTCQYNKRSTLADAALLAEFDAQEGRACCAPTGRAATPRSPPR